MTDWRARLEAKSTAANGRDVERPELTVDDAYDILVEAVALERARWRRVQEHIAQCTDANEITLRVFECPYCEKVIK